MQKRKGRNRSGWRLNIVILAFSAITPLLMVFGKRRDVLKTFALMLRGIDEHESLINDRREIKEIRKGRTR